VKLYYAPVQTDLRQILLKCDFTQADAKTLTMFLFNQMCNGTLECPK